MIGINENDLTDFKGHNAEIRNNMTRGLEESMFDY
jgi:hypothetical protein